MCDEVYESYGLIMVWFNRIHVVITRGVIVGKLCPISRLLNKVVVLALLIGKRAGLCSSVICM